ncbi:MAG TPA: glycosyltransferase family 39 protein [Gemmatimonadaceae bacterium]|nr:glycosyltransferase family 39 protein [Gemmatimonadaceae bacterium]
MSFRPRETALVVAIVSAIAVWWVWAAIDPAPLVEDEISYVLQSQIFASGHWTAPSPPAPDFFQQAHVLTIPAVASKYPPGHALLMSIGTWLGARALVPLLLTGLTGALLFLLVRRISNDWVALLTSIIWLGDPINLRFRAGYYSELTSEAMWFLSWWSLLEWRETRRTRWLLAVAASIGWGAITRPLTMLAFAVPVGMLVIRDVARLRLWKDFGLAVALGTVILGVIPLWSAQTTGSWRVTPLALYSHDYLPYDKPGFGVDSTPPARKLSPVNEVTYAGFFDEHVRHTPSNLPRIALDRLRVIAGDEWSGARLVLVPFVVLGLFALNAEAVFALACALALFVGYLSYGHWSRWTLYYFEAMPVLSLLAALGVWKALTYLRARGRLPNADGGSTSGRAPTLATAALLMILTGYELHTWRVIRQGVALWDTRFRALVGKLPMHEAVIFVHYAPGIVAHQTVITNSPHLSDEPIWIVNDLGPRNTELMRYTGPRIPLAFYEKGERLEIDRSLIGTKPK